MLIELHAIQNHSPANLNRDDLGAPKTCYFGGVLRSRISSQCIKRSIRMSDEFKHLLGGIRTRQLAKVIAEKVTGQSDVKKRAAKILKECGIAPKDRDEDRSDMLVYTTRQAIEEMAKLLQNGHGKSDEQLAAEFGTLISTRVAVPDMALSGRMLETGVLKDTTVDAALQVAHAISTHEARPEVDYYVAADDIPGDDAGAGYVDEAMFASACFYKYFSIHWETLVANLKGYGKDHEKLAAHTVGAFIRGAALAVAETGWVKLSFAAGKDGEVLFRVPRPAFKQGEWSTCLKVAGEKNMWSGYETLNVVVYNPSPRAMQVGVLVEDLSGYIVGMFPTQEETRRGQMYQATANVGPGASLLRMGCTRD